MGVGLGLGVGVNVAVGVGLAVAVGVGVVSNVSERAGELGHRPYAAGNFIVSDLDCVEAWNHRRGIEVEGYRVF